MSPHSPLPNPLADRPLLSRPWLFWLGMFGLFVGFIWLLHAMLLPFVVGMAIAYLLDPVADWLEAKGLGRTSAVVVITLVFLCLWIAGLLLLLPLLWGQLADFIQQFPDLMLKARKALVPITEWWREMINRQSFRFLFGNRVSQVIPTDPNAVVKMAAGQFSTWVGAALGRLVHGTQAVVNLGSLMLITPVVAFYFLRDWDIMVAKVDSWLPRRHHGVIRARVIEIDAALSGFVRGQSMVCLALGSFYAIGLTLVGLDYGLIIGLSAGLLAFIPYVGTIVGFVVATGVGLVQFGPVLTDLAPVIAVFLIGQGLEGFVLTPRLVGESVGLHPVWVIFALMAGGALFGFVGILIALPVAAALAVLVRFGLSEYLSSPLYGEQPEDGLDDGG